MDNMKNTIDSEANYNIVQSDELLVTLLHVKDGFTNDKGEIYNRNGCFIDFPRELGNKQRKNLDIASVAKKFSGSIVVCLVHERRNYSYYHWIYETLPKLIYLSQNRDKIKVGKIYFHCGFLGFPYQRQALKKLGFNFWQLVDARRCKSLMAKEIIAIKLNSERLNPNTQLCQTIKSAFVSDISTQPFRKIYLTRDHVKSGRKIINELQLRNLLTSYGFEIVIPDKLNIVDQAKLFNESKYIISPHGASLANIVFCEPHTRILELFNQWDSSTWSPLYSKIARTGNLELTTLAPAKVEKDDESHHRSDFYADLESIKATLDCWNM